jgi:tRNA dimethylallyltransferase
MDKNILIPNSELKILVVVGPTSSGKSELAVRLAGRFNGEIISCDSRQIYKGMDIGTGKIQGKWLVDNQRGRAGCQHYVYKKIVHHLIDFVNPKKQYSAALFQDEAKKIIADVLKRGKLPILCGGTAHWIDAVVYNQQLPDVKPNLKLRKQLEKRSADELYKRLAKLDPRRAATIDRHNKRRLIRALEIVLTTGKPVPSNGAIPSLGSRQALRSAADEGPRLGLRDSSASDALGLRMTPYKTLWIGVRPAQAVLEDKIKKRLKQRLKAGMVNEVKRLRGQGLSWKKLESFGLEYKFVSLYLQKKLTNDEMFEQLFTAIKQYSKRQMTWWKKNKSIRWINKSADVNKIIGDSL